jgi:hypothetical protein
MPGQYLVTSSCGLLLKDLSKPKHINSNMNNSAGRIAWAEMREEMPLRLPIFLVREKNQ